MPHIFFIDPDKSGEPINLELGPEQIEGLRALAGVRDLTEDEALEFVLRRGIDEEAKRRTDRPIN